MQRPAVESLQHQPIAFVIYGLRGGGAEKVCTTLANLLQESGQFQVTIYFMESHPQDYLLHPDVHTVQLNHGTYPSNTLRFFSIPLQAYQLFRLLQGTNTPVLCFLQRANFLGGFLKLLGYKGTVITSEHVPFSAHYQGLASFFLKFWIRLLYPKTDHAVGVSQAVVQELIDLGTDPLTTHCIYNPIPEPLTQPSPQERPFTVAYLSRLEPSKNHRDLFTAFAHADIPQDSRLMIIGVGSQQTHLENYAKELGIQSRVDFFGFLQDPMAQLVQADIFVMPSLYEGFGMVLVEAMACGLPVIAYDCPVGPREIIGQDYGILTPIGDTTILAQAITSLYQNPEKRKELSTQSLKRAKDFNPKIILQKYLKLLTGSN